MFHFRSNKKNQLFIYPTETFYALGCAFDDKEAVKRIYQLKKRDDNKAMPVIIAHWQMFELITSEVTKQQREFLLQHWPAPLTAILKAPKHISKHLNSDNHSVALRISSNETARALSRYLDKPIISTSANLSGSEEYTQLNPLKQIFADRVDHYIDGGVLEGKSSSTIIDLRNTHQWHIIREGAYRVQFRNRL